MKTVKIKKTIFILCSVLFFSILISGCSKKESKVQSESYPQRIISLSPAASEILFAIGAENQIVAVSEFTDYPLEATEKPVVGGFDGKTISVEKILSFEPDFVYLTAGMHDFLIETLNRYEIPFFVSKAASIDDVKNEIFEAGKITGHEKEAQKICSEITKTVKDCKKIDTEISVYYEVWNAPYMTAGNKSFINDLIVSAGGKNIFGTLDSDYPIVSEETIIASKPQVILIPASSGVSAQNVKNRSGWEMIPAVENGNVFIIDDNIFNRPGPRILNALEILSQILKTAAGGQ